MLLSWVLFGLYQMLFGRREGVFFAMIVVVFVSQTQIVKCTWSLF